MEVYIKVGDCVSVNFNNSQLTLCSRATVKYIPVATGDNWIFQDKNTGQIHYVSEGCTVSKLSEDT